MKTRHLSPPRQEVEPETHTSSSEHHEGTHLAITAWFTKRGNSATCCHIKIQTVDIRSLTETGRSTVDLHQVAHMEGLTKT
ncbi:hypothetical protein INR49_017861 [Caranx melampygus]|nr:hypothetical protein INR49_017861 [Caranx melampygus]